MGKSSFFLRFQGIHYQRQHHRHGRRRHHRRRVRQNRFSLVADIITLLDLRLRWARPTLRNRLALREANRRQRSDRHRTAVRSSRPSSTSSSSRSWHYRAAHRRRAPLASRRLCCAERAKRRKKREEAAPPRAHARAGERRYASRNPRPAGGNQEQKNERARLHNRRRRRRLQNRDAAGAQTAARSREADGRRPTRPTSASKNSAAFLDRNGRPPLRGERRRARAGARRFLGVAGGSHEGFCALTNGKAASPVPQRENRRLARRGQHRLRGLPRGGRRGGHLRHRLLVLRPQGRRAAPHRRLLDFRRRRQRLRDRQAPPRTRSPASTAAPSRTRSMRWCGTIPARTCFDALPLTAAQFQDRNRALRAAGVAERRGSAAAGIILRENIARIAEYINAAARYFDAFLPCGHRGRHLPRRAGDGTAAPMLRCDCRVSVLTREPVSRRGGKRAAAVDKRLTGVYNNREETKIAGAVRIYPADRESGKKDKRLWTTSCKRSDTRPRTFWRRR